MNPYSIRDALAQWREGQPLPVLPKEKEKRRFLAWILWAHLLRHPSSLETILSALKALGEEDLLFERIDGVSPIWRSLAEAWGSDWWDYHPPWRDTAPFPAWFMRRVGQKLLLMGETYAYLFFPWLSPKEIVAGLPDPPCTQADQRLLAFARAREVLGQLKRQLKGFALHPSIYYPGTSVFFSGLVPSPEVIPLRRDGSLLLVRMWNKGTHACLTAGREYVLLPSSPQEALGEEWASLFPVLTPATAVRLARAILVMRRQAREGKRVDLERALEAFLSPEEIRQMQKARIASWIAEMGSP